MTSATLSNKYLTVSVSSGKDDLTIDELWSYVVRPLLIATGYEPETVDGLTGGRIEE